MMKVRRDLLPGQLVVWPGRLVFTNRGVGLAACADAAKRLLMRHNVQNGPLAYNNAKVLPDPEALPRSKSRWGIDALGLGALVCPAAPQVFVLLLTAAGPFNFNARHRIRSTQPERHWQLRLRQIA